MTARTKEGSIEVRVRYCECDPMGVAHHSVYPVWLEMARTELLRSQGAVYRELEERDVLFVVIDLSIRYRRPAKYDDVLTIHVKEMPGPEGRRVKVEHQYQLFRDQELLATASTTLACVNRQGRPIAIPPGVMD
jgi:acyl-CoA thioester hydrolase